MKKIVRLMFVSLILLWAVPSCAEDVIPAPPDVLSGERTVEQTVIDYFASVGIDAAFVKQKDSVYTFDLGQGRAVAVNLFSSGKLRWTLMYPDDALLAQWMDMRFRSAADVCADPAQPESEKQAVTGNTLIAFERYGDQSVRVALAAIREGDHPELDDMRVALCKRILGERLDVPGGCGSAREFADRMVILAQDVLPPVDETLFSDDPVERLVMRAVMDYNNEMRTSRQEDGELWQVVCAVHLYETEEKNNTLTVWAGVRESQYALFGGKKIKEGSGSSVPTRLTFAKDDEGKWTLSEYLTPRDGTGYWPSIQKMCEGHLLLAERMVNLPREALNAALEQHLMIYLNSTGIYHPDAEESAISPRSPVQR